MTAPREPDDRDLPAAYVAGDPDAVRAAAPKEPSEVEWAAVCQNIMARLTRPEPSAGQPARSWLLRTGWLAGAAAIVAATVGAWVAFDQSRLQESPQILNLPELAEGKVAPTVQEPPLPHEPQPDPLAEFAVLPMASADDVVLTRVPGDGWFPIGAHPLPGALSLATADEVELDDPDATWPNVTPTPGDAPMIFATKPR
jgi:hypothetical protein